MKVILHLGYRSYLFKTVEDATKVIRVISKSLCLEHKDMGEIGFQYVPSKTSPFDQINLEIVPDHKVNLSSLIPVKPVGPTKRTGKLLLNAPVEPEPLFHPNPYAPKE